MMRSELWTWTTRGVGLGLGLLAVLVLALVVQASADVVVLVIISILLASAINPVVDWAREHSRLSRVQAIMLIYVLLIVIAAALLLLVVPAAVNQLETLSLRAPELIAEARLMAETLEPEFVGTVLLRLVNAISSTLAQTGLSAPDTEEIVEAGLTAADAAISVITVLTLVFFWLISREVLQRFILALLPASQRSGTRGAWNQIEGRMGYWLRGQLILMTTIGVLTTIAYLLLGLENAILLGVIAGLAEVIPIVGPAIGAIPALIVAVVSGGPELALAVAVVYVIIQVLEGQILVPVVMRRSVGLPPFIVIVSLLIGAAVAGLVGALLAVPVAAAGAVVLQNVQARQTPVPLSPVENDDDDEEDEPPLVHPTSEALQDAPEADGLRG